MADNAFELHDLMRFNPEHFTDPVPPWWVFGILDKVVIRDLAVVNLERTRALQEINMRAIEGTLAILKKAKF